MSTGGTAPDPPTRSPLPPSTLVDVLNRHLGIWTRGFEVAELHRGWLSHPTCLRRQRLERTLLPRRRSSPTKPSRFLVALTGVSRRLQPDHPVRWRRMRERTRRRCHSPLTMRVRTLAVELIRSRSAKFSPRVHRPEYVSCIRQIGVWGQCRPGLTQKFRLGQSALSASLIGPRLLRE